MACCHEGTEKSSIFKQENGFTASPRRKHRRVVHGIAIVTLLFILWSYGAIPGVRKFDEPEEVLEKNDGLLDFANVRPLSIPSHGQPSLFSSALIAVSDHSQREARMASMFHKLHVRSPHSANGLPPSFEYLQG